MRKIFSLFAIASAALLFGACHKTKNNTPTTAGVMFVNGCAGTTAVDVTANGGKVNNAQSIAFQKNTGYLPFAGGTDSIAFVLSNLGTPLIKNGSVNFSIGSSYSIYAGGLITSPSFLVLQDDLSSPSGGNAKVRFVNLSSDALTETAYAGTASFATGVTSGAGSGFSLVTAGSYTIKAGDPSNISTVVNTSSPVTLASGRIYTVILTGTMTGSGGSALQLTVINNN